MKSFNLCLIVLLATLTILTSCVYENPYPRTEFPFPRLATYPATNIGSTSATLHAELFSVGKDPILEHGFVWGRYVNPLVDQIGTQQTLLGNQPKVGKLEAAIEYPFEQDITYYVKFFIKTEKTIMYGEQVTFKAGK